MVTWWLHPKVVFEDDGRIESESANRKGMGVASVRNPFRGTYFKEVLKEI